VIQSVLFVCWQISIDYKAVEKGCLHNPIEKCIPIASGDEVCIKIGSILVTNIHAHLVLVVGVNTNRYIKLFLAFSRKKCEFAPLALVLLLPGCFLILSTSESSPLRG